MLEKIVPVIIALVVLQLFIRYMNKKRKNEPVSHDRADYKKRIDELMKVSNYDEGVNAGHSLSEEVKKTLGNPEIITGIPENMRDVRRSLNRIIDAVTQGVKAKTGLLKESESQFKDPAAMFDEIVEVVNRHRTDKD